MSRTLKARKTQTLLASLALAASALFAPAPAHATFDFGCQSKVWQYCSANWQALGYYGPEDCFWYWYEAACRQYPPNPWDPNWPYLPPVP